MVNGFLYAAPLSRGQNRHCFMVNYFMILLDFKDLNNINYLAPMEGYKYSIRVFVRW